MISSISHATTPYDDQSDLLALMDRITQNCLSAPSEKDSLTRDINALAEEGWLFACVPYEAGGSGLSYETPSVDVALDFFFRLGAANLSLGRLFEGHVNACKLINTLAKPEQATMVWEKIKKGAFLGVWGADGHKPVSIQTNSDTHSLNGAKSFCSGLGNVSLAIVSAKTVEGLQLILADVSQQSRGDPEQWQLSGMQATRSGTYDFQDLPFDQFSLLGAPNAYYEEPHFLGGQWRYLALHAGCVAAIAQEVSTHIKAMNGNVSDSTAVRVARIVGLSKQAMMWARSIAYDTEIYVNLETGTQAILGRELVESACVEAIALAERTVGTRAFQSGSRLERLCRDLRTYLRQAALDQRLVTAGHNLLALDPNSQRFFEHCGGSYEKGRSAF